MAEKSTSKEIVWNESEHDKEKETAAKAECDKDKALNVLDTLLCAVERLVIQCSTITFLSQATNNFVLNNLSTKLSHPYHIRHITQSRDTRADR